MAEKENKSGEEYGSISHNLHEDIQTNMMSLHLKSEHDMSPNQNIFDSKMSSSYFARPDESSASAGEATLHSVATGGTKMPQFSFQSQPLSVINASQVIETTGKNVYSQGFSAVHFTPAYIGTAATSFSAVQQPATLTAEQNSIAKQSTRAFNWFSNPDSSTGTIFSATEPKFPNASISYHYLNASQLTPVNALSNSPTNTEDTYKNFLINRRSWRPQCPSVLTGYNAQDKFHQRPPGIICPTLKDQNLEPYIQVNHPTFQDVITLPPHLFEPHLDVPALAPFFCIHCNKICGIPFYEERTNLKDKIFHSQYKKKNNGNEKYVLGLKRYAENIDQKLQNLGKKTKK